MLPVNIGCNVILAQIWFGVEEKRLNGIFKSCSWRASAPQAQDPPCALRTNAFERSRILTCQCLELPGALRRAWRGLVSPFGLYP